MRRLGALALAAALAGCGALPPRGHETGDAAPGPLTLRIAHINDHHAHLEAIPDVELRLDGLPTQVQLGGFAQQTALFKALDGTPNLLKLHAGDALTGSLYYTFFKGEADAQLMNTICFDAFVPGNHEFDDGDATLRQFLDALARGPCQTPVLSANVVPAAGTPLAPEGAAPLLRPWIVRRIGGVDVGLVGLTVSGKTQVSSRPLPSTRFLDEATAAQAAIDALTARGVRHIVLLTHIGHEADKALAARLSGVDVIIGGDSHTLLGDFGAQGIGSAGPYPTRVKNRSGEMVCIGQVWEYGKALGLMQVRFDSDGRVTDCDGQASLVVGEPFRRRDATGQWHTLDAAASAALRARLASTPQVSTLPPDAAAARALAVFSEQLDAQKTRAIGTAAEPLCLVRVPGETTHASAGMAGCEQANTLARGSDVAQAVAQAFLEASRRADVALQNAGGARAPVPAGTLTMDTAFRVLPFANTLVEIELSGAELLAALEDGVANHLDLGRSTGSHPYAAGLRWHLDMRAPRGARFTQVEVRDRVRGTWQALDPSRNYVLVTHDYLATGRDGYDTLAHLSRQGRGVDTYLLYTQTFVDHLRVHSPLARVPRTEASHQAVVTRDGRRLP